MQSFLRSIWPTDMYDVTEASHIPPIYGEGLLPLDRLCGLVVRVSGYKSKGIGFDPRRY
jgi:hypothetical protein